MPHAWLPHCSSPMSCCPDLNVPLCLPFLPPNCSHPVLLFRRSLIVPLHHWSIVLPAPFAGGCHTVPLPHRTNTLLPRCLTSPIFYFPTTASNQHCGIAPRLPHCLLFHCLTDILPQSYFLGDPMPCCPISLLSNRHTIWTLHLPHRPVASRRDCLTAVMLYFLSRYIHRLPQPRRLTLRCTSLPHVPTVLVSLCPIAAFQCHKTLCPCPLLFMA